MDAIKVLSEENFQIAKALYLQWLRLLIDKGVIGECTSPRKAQRKAKVETNLFEGMEDSDAEDDDVPESTLDRVRTEIKIWDTLSDERIASFKDSSGLVE